jgi:16S rRNA (cytosine967-C5)-methyltransferase
MAADSAAPAPPLADALVLAAAAWVRLRAGESLDRALAAELPAPRAGGRDAVEARLAGAVRDLLGSTARRCALLDYLLDRLVHRPADPAVRALLAIALAQLLAGSYSEFTLVDQAVRAARAHPRTAGAAGLVNAVLREFLRRRAELTEQGLRDPARRYNVPPWWLERVQQEYGARAPGLLAAQLEEPPLVLRVNVRRTTPDDYLALLGGAGLAATRVGPAAVWLHRATAVERIPGFAEGLVSVQDAGAQLAAPWAGASDGMRVLDACAAPGGKTAHLLELADCHVDAVEQDAQRALRIDANLRRLGLDGPRARVHVADVLQTGSYWDGRAYDRILLDAPCSASGVVRRHPDVVWLRRSSDVAKLATQQAKMLRTLWPLLAPAGRLLYVVCSVFAEEGRRQIAGFLRREPGARALRLGLRGIPQYPQGEPAWVQLLPTPVAIEPTGPADVALPALHDGFFYALLEKT